MTASDQPDAAPDQADIAAAAADTADQDEGGDPDAVARAEATPPEALDG